MAVVSGQGYGGSPLMVELGLCMSSEQLVQCRPDLMDMFVQSLVVGQSVARVEENLIHQGVSQ